MKKIFTKVDQYFLSQQSPFSSKKTINTKPLKILGLVLFMVTMVTLLLTGPDSTKDGNGTTNHLIEGQDPLADSKSKSTHQSHAIPDAYMPSGYFTRPDKPYHGAPKVERQYNASQFVAPSSQNLLSSSGLPLASTIPAKLLGVAISSDTTNPVIAETTADSEGPDGATVIPAGTRIVGQASFDDQTRRLQIRFHSLVFEDGSQRTLSGMALHSDGSSGLAGNYHSGSMIHQVGRFISTFVGGLAEGMKEKEVTATGQPIEKGNIKNGLLKGVANTATDQAQQTSQEMEKTRPYLEVAQGTEFLVYLEKEFVL